MVDLENGQGEATDLHWPSQLHEPPSGQGQDPFSSMCGHLLLGRANSFC